MAQLTGNPIQSSYLGLLKTSDNAALQANGFNAITDGAGNDSMIKMSQTELQLGSNINTQYFKQSSIGSYTTEIKDASIRLDDATQSQYLVVDGTNAGFGAGSNYIVTTAGGNVISGNLLLMNGTVSGLDGLAPTGGTAGQVLTKTTGTDYDYGWSAAGGGGGVTAFKTAYVSETQATSSCDTVRSTVLIPANTFAAGDVLMMRSMQETANQTGYTYSTIWITTNGSIGDAQGGENLSQIQSPADGKGFYEKTLFIQTSDGTGLGTSCWAAADSVETAATNVVGGDAIMDLAIDWTINQYMTVSVCIDNSGATWTNYGAILTKLN